MEKGKIFRQLKVTNNLQTYYFEVNNFGVLSLSLNRRQYSGSCLM
jgi:hypothetical protein